MRKKVSGYVVIDIGGLFVYIDPAFPPSVSNF